MENEMVLRFSPNAKFLFHDDLAIVFNRLNRKWIKIPKVCQTALEECDKLNYTFRQLMEAMADDEDRAYMSQIVEALVGIEVLNTPKHTSRLHDVSFAISNRCNLHCNHCMVNVDSCSKEENFTLEQITLALDKIIAARPEAITITGGEALVRRDFKEVITYLRTNFNGHISLMSNGTLINEKNVKYIIDSIDSLDISLDGVNEETCSIVRGKGVFTRVVSAIKLLQANGFNKITTSMILSATNQNYVNDFFALNEQLGCKGILRALSFVGQAEQNKELLTTDYSYKERANLPDRLAQDQKSSQFHTCSCAAGCKTLTIEGDGGIYPCNLFIEPEHCLGNIMKVNSLAECLVAGENEFLSKSLQQYEPDQMEKCRDCNVNYFCWSCMHEVADLTTQKDFEERCSGMKSYLMAVWE